MSTVRIQVRRGTAAQWTAANPILAAGEMGYETDTSQIRVGDDIHTWSQLPVINETVEGFQNALADYVLVSDRNVADGVAALDPSGNLLVPGSSIIIEGATNNAFETTLAVADPTADRTITLPNASGTIALTSDIAELAQDSINDSLVAGTGITKSYDDAANTLTVSVDTSAIQPRVADISDTEIGYLNNVSSNIQTQLDGKFALANASTTNIAEGTNLYFTNERAQDAVGTIMGSGLTYNDAGDTIVVDTAVIATRSFTTDAVSTAVSDLIASSPSTLNTLNELATALGNDASFATTITNSLGTKLALSGGTMSGNISLDGNKVTNLGAPVADNDATRKIYVDSTISSSIATEATNRDSAIASAISTEVTNRNTAISTETTNRNSAITSSINAEVSDRNTAIANHSAVTTSVHGIANTAELATKEFAASLLTGATKSNIVITGDKNGLTITAENGVSDSTTDNLTEGTTNLYLTNERVDDRVDALISVSSGLTKTYNDAAGTLNFAPDTAVLATRSFVDDAKADAISTADGHTTTAIATAIGTEVTDRNSAIGTHAAVTTTVHGIANTANLVATTDTGSVTSTMIADGTIVNADINASAAIALSKLATDPLARANHTGTQLASTISDFNEAAQDAIGGILGSGLTYNDAGDAITVNSSVVQLRVSGIDDTEIGYLNGVTSAIQTQIDAKAPLASPALTGSPTAPTAAAADNSTKIATTAYADRAASNAASALVAASPAALDTLNELAAALGNDASFSTTMTNALAAKAPLASPTFTGTVTLPTGTVTSGMILDGTIVDADINASAAIAQSKISGLSTSLGLKANLAAPSFTGGVTVDASGVVFTDGVQNKAGVPSLTAIGPTTSTSCTLDQLGTAAANRDTIQPLAGAIAITFEATGNAKYAIGSSITFYQASGTGANFVESGITLLATPGKTLRTTNSSVTITKIAATTWLLAGDLKA